MRRATPSKPQRAERKAIRRLCCCGVAVLALGCAEAERDEPAAEGLDPAVRFFALEERLLAADRVRVDFLVTAQGAVEANLEGTLDVRANGEGRLAASGMFAGETVDLALFSNRDQVELGNGTETTRVASPAYLKESLVIGLTRMGILHNLARLTGGAAPDHAEGGVRDWVTLGAFAAGAEALSFDLTVAGESAGSAELLVDSDGIPTLRRQTVEFPTGQMRVVERYSAFTIDE